MLASKEMRNKEYIHSVITQAMQGTPQDHSHVKTSGATSAEWKGMVNAMRSYQLIKINEEMYYRWLEVLPPAGQGAGHFLFAEGEELPKLFFKQNDCYYCIRMRHTNPDIQAYEDLLDAQRAELHNPRKASAYQGMEHWTIGASGTCIAFFSWEDGEIVPEIDAIMRKNSFTNYKDRFNWYWHPGYWWQDELEELAQKAGINIECLKRPERPHKGYAHD